MNSLTCDQADLLLELSQSGACKPDERRALEAHLDACPACSANLDKGRQLVGLLDLHYQMPDRIARLKQRLRQEGKGRRDPHRVLLRRFAALAALLLVTLGLSGLLMPWQTDSLPGHQLMARLDLFGMKREMANPAAFVPDHLLRMGHPLSELDLALSLSNTSRRPIRLGVAPGMLQFTLVEPGGHIVNGTLEPKRTIPNREGIVLQPGEHITLPLRPLPEPGRGLDLSRAGDYSLWIRYTVEWREAGVIGVRKQTLESSPVRISVPGPAP